MIALVSTLVAPSLWFQSGLAMICLQLYACYLNVSVRVVSVWVHLFRFVLGNQKNCAVWDVYVCCVQEDQLRLDIMVYSEQLGFIMGCCCHNMAIK